jgi:REP element-mobilizing transposase RayT
MQSVRIVQPPRGRIIIAHHLVLMGYGHWLPNDIRGSGSDEIRKELLRELGGIHNGRKIVQPTRPQLRAFHGAGEPLLEQEVLWFAANHRESIAQAFAETAERFGYVVWARAVLKNHAHLVVKRHQHRHDVMWRTFAEAAAQSLRVIADLPPRHRVWGERPFSRFLYTPCDVRTRIKYVNENPENEGLPPQTWEFVQEYPAM